MQSLLSESIDWLRDNTPLALSLVGASIVVLIVSLWAGYRYLTTIPPDYFTHEHKRLESWRQSHRALRWSLLIGKNVLGTVLILLGLVMLFTPGQGILTMLLGIALVDVPGKRAIERRIVQQPAVLKALNGLRTRAGQPPLRF